MASPDENETVIVSEVEFVLLTFAEVIVGVISDGIEVSTATDPIKEKFRSISLLKLSAWLPSVS